MEEQHGATVRMRRLAGYQFAVDAGAPEWAMTVDEPPPVGEGRGPSAGRLLAAATGHCLSASLLFCLQKARVEVSGMTTEVRATVRRNQRGRLRVTALDVAIQAEGLDPAQQASLQRCLSIFEEFCTVTASIRQGIPVNLTMHPQPMEVSTP